MANEKRLDLIDRRKVYENACAGCIRHGEKPGECYHDEPCEHLIFEFTVAEPVDAVEVVHGRWVVENEESIRCPNCCFNRASIKMPLNYCPNCGAKMVGGNGDGCDL